MNQEQESHKSSAGSLLITNIGQLATPDGSCGTPLTGPRLGSIRTIKDAAIYCKGGMIARVGPREEVEHWVEGAGADVALLDAGRRVAVPGFVDPHTHLVFEGNRALEFEQRIRGAGYLEILASGGGILDTVHRTREATAERLLDRALARARLMAASGTTTVEVKSGYGLDLMSEVKILQVVQAMNQKVPMDFIPTFLGAHAVPPEFAGDAGGFVEYLVAEALPVIASLGLAEFADVFCETGVFSPEQSRRVLLASREKGLLPKIHADEMASSGGAEVAAEVGAVSADHLVKVSSAGMDLMANKGVIAVLLPATSLFMGTREGAPAREMISRGIAIALATDCNPGTSPVTSMQLVMSLASSYLRMTPGEALSAATLNAAFAVNKGHTLGALEQGRRADIVIMDAEDYREIAYFMGSNLACAVVKDGSVLASDGRPGF